MTDHATLRRLAENATPGPWHLDSIETGEHALCFYHDRHDGYASELLADRLTKANAEYLGAVPPETVLALLDENADLARRVRVLEQQVLSMSGWRFK